MLWHGHRREAPLAYQAPVIEVVALFDLLQGNGLGDTAHELDIHYPALVVVRVWTRLRYHTSQADNRGITLAVIDQHLIAGPHILNDAYCLGIPYSIPDGYFVSLQVGEGVVIGISFCQKIGHRIPPFLLNTNETAISNSKLL